MPPGPAGLISGAEPGPVAASTRTVRQSGPGRLLAAAPDFATARPEVPAEAGPDVFAVDTVPDAREAEAVLPRSRCPRPRRNL
ncbi:hypothetical protein AQJ58_20845 [Streptomyces sp. DSM 15324]|nr:hypothetical protein AQJ58_20845 [Streptomyces sp. DSM 15324]